MLLLMVIDAGSDTLTTPTLLKMVKGSPSAIEYLTTMSVNPGRPDFIDNFAKAAPELKFESYAGEVIYTHYSSSWSTFSRSTLLLLLLCVFAFKPL
jgi:hypothetical protein